jgi:hypothetical protein
MCLSILILICVMDNNDVVEKYTDSGYKNSVILFRLVICGRMKPEPLLDILPISQHHVGGRYRQEITNMTLFFS